MIGRTISHYTILEQLGQGGMGVVYKAEDTLLKRPVALKFLAPELTREESAKRRFITEAQTASSLDHPNICTIHEISESREGQLFICMAYYEGETVGDKIASRSLVMDTIVDIVAQVARGLMKAHERGIVHRDIKPANIMITTDGQVKIVDFGIAKLAGGTRLTKAGMTVGTAAYMSPEQIRGDAVDQRTDIWSLGAVFYEMVAGQAPFRGEYDQAVIYSVLHETPAPVSELCDQVSPGIARIIMKTLSRDPDERYSDASHLLDDLSQAHRDDVTTGPGRRAPEPQPSIAVLPFVNMSPDPENEYFGDGLAEELLNALTKLKGIRVAARTSAFSFRGKDIDIREIGEKLNVSNVLEGSVRRAGSRLRVTAQLIAIADGYHLWSERYDREMDDIFAIQDEIARAIVEQLKVQLAPRKKTEPLVRRYTENVEAYSCFLKARYHWYSLKPDGWEKSYRYLEETIAIDPGYAPAYTWMAIWHQSQLFWGEADPREAYHKGMEAIQKALELDDTFADVYNVLGVMKFAYNWKWAESEKDLRYSLELDPTSALGHVNYAIFLMIQNRSDEALAEARLAQRLDPLSSMVNTWTGLIPLYAGRCSEAIIEFNKVIDMDPGYWQAHVHLGNAYLQANRIEDAIIEAESALELSGGASVTRMMLSCIYQRAGRVEEAGQQYEILKKKAETAHVSPMFFAWMHLARGEDEEACRWLKKAVDEHDVWACWYWVGAPGGLSFNDPRCDALAKRMGLL